MPDPSNGRLDGRYISEIGVSVAVERLLRDGYQVALPIIDDGYDLLAFCGRRYWRIQVKATACDTKNRYRIRIGRGANKKTFYTPDQVDAFILVHTTTGVAMCVPYAFAKGRQWINFSDHRRFSDFGAIRRLKPHSN